MSNDYFDWLIQEVPDINSAEIVWETNEDDEREPVIKMIIGLDQVPLTFTRSQLAMIMAELDDEIEIGEKE